MQNDPIRVVELFAGVGGFRIGLENASPRFDTVWADQWEPGADRQYAFECYCTHFGRKAQHVCEDIASAKGGIPPHDLLVGGFPCQDYSIANKAGRGIEGKKGALWWQIDSIVKSRRPQYILLENVDGLLGSPAKQRGRDLGMILCCLYHSGYAVEWRVINAADYGQPQRRRRIFIFAFRNDTRSFKSLATTTCIKGLRGMHSWCMRDGFFAPSFPLERHTQAWSEVWVDETRFEGVQQISEGLVACFYNTGVMINGRIYSVETVAEKEQSSTLDSVISRDTVDLRYFIKEQDMEQWRYLKGAKRERRQRRDGSAYVFSEGAMLFPDPLSRPARTMLTSEGTINRSSHVVVDKSTQRLRILTPVECERLNGFPDGWTDTGMPERFRYFTMGNALVVPLAARMGRRLLELF